VGQAVQADAEQANADVTSHPPDNDPLSHDDSSQSDNEMDILADTARMSHKRHHSEDTDPDLTGASETRRSKRTRKLTEKARLAAEQSDSEIEVDPVVCHFRKRKRNESPSGEQQKVARCELIAFVCSYFAPV
jgi:hypothetical protein